MITWSNRIFVEKIAKSNGFFVPGRISFQPGRWDPSRGGR